MDRKLREELIRDEGVRLKAYKDSVGLWTIGVGHLLGAEPRMTVITMSEAMALLEADVAEAEATVVRLVPDAADWHKCESGACEGWSVRYRALVNMAFNLGSRLAKFEKFLGAVRAENWAAAAEHMMNSKWATQVGKRAERLRDMVLTGSTG